MTFFTLDRGFCAKRRAYAHQNFAAVFVDAPVERFPELVDRFLRHPAFRSHATRMGLVFKISERTIVYWRLSDQSQTEVSW